MSDSARIAGRNRQYTYEARNADPAFSVAWDEIEQELTERMEAEAARRGMLGVDRDVYWQGRVVGQEREYSDQLLMFLLRGRRPDLYSERHRLEHSGPQGGPVQLEVPTDQERSVEVAAILLEAGVLHSNGDGGAE